MYKNEYETLVYIVIFFHLTLLPGYVNDIKWLKVIGWYGALFLLVMFLFTVFVVIQTHFKERRASKQNGFSDTI